MLASHTVCFARCFGYWYRGFKRRNILCVLLSLVRGRRFARRLEREDTRTSFLLFFFFFLSLFFNKIIYLLSKGRERELDLNKFKKKKLKIKKKPSRYRALPAGESRGTVSREVKFRNGVVARRGEGVGPTLVFR
jgi:hypothetical protein